MVFSGACDWEGGRHPGKMQKAHISCGAAGASSENYDESFNCTDTYAVSDDEVQFSMLGSNGCFMAFRIVFRWLGF